MKNTIIRFVTLMTLATSISAFAFSGKAATAENSNCNNTKSETAAVVVSATKKAGQDQAPSDNGPEKSRKDLIEQQNKQWLHDVQNIVAG